MRWLGFDNILRMENKLKISRLANVKRIVFLMAAAIFLFAVGFSGWLIYRDYHKISTPSKLSQESVVSEDSHFPPSTTSPQNFLPEERISSEPSGQPDYPDLNRPISFPQNFPEDGRQLFRQKIEKIVSQLRQNPGYFDGWLELSRLRKMINDYEGAAEILEYLAKISPKNFVVFNNLGDLYGYYLKDYKKAEENFLKAIENGPHEIYLYRILYEFYRDVVKNEEKLKEILKRGIELNPTSSQDLQKLL